MIRSLLILLVLVGASVATAQPRYDIHASAGIGGVASAPYSQLVVNIQRNEDRPFVGRIVADVGMHYGRSGRRGGGRGQSSEVTVTRDVSLEEGVRSRRFVMDVPVSRGLTISVQLERQLRGGQFEGVAATEVSPHFSTDESELVGFVSPSRLQLAEPHLSFRVSEIPVEEVPTGWKSLSGYDAIVVNDDRLSRAQTRAIEKYLVAGGTVVLSPRSAGSFNPERLAGSLLDISPNPSSESVELGDFAVLIRPTAEAGMDREMRGTEYDEDGNPVRRPLVMPEPDALVKLWTDRGRAKGLLGHDRLISSARVGAGNLVLLHTDISRTPFTTGDNSPTQACVNLLSLAFDSFAWEGVTPERLMHDSDVRNHIDIAGRRIPGRDILIALMLAYVAVAGVGAFVVARRIKRPEFFPATLLVAAALSVGLVFGLGELFKRTGDRVKAVNLVVSDETTGRNAVFTLGCAYAVDGDEYRFVNGHDVVFQPSAMERPSLTGRAGPVDPLPHDIELGGSEATTTVRDLVRWQNVFFLRREPADLDGFRLSVEDISGALRVENGTKHELKGCVFLVGRGETTDLGASCDWHYAPRLASSGSSDAQVTFSESTRLENDADALARMLEQDVGGDGYQVLKAMFDVDADQGIGRARDLGTLESALYSAGLMPMEGEFLMLSTLPDGALERGLHGARGVDEDDVAQSSLWFVRGHLRGE